MSTAQPKNTCANCQHWRRKTQDDLTPPYSGKCSVNAERAFVHLGYSHKGSLSCLSTFTCDKHTPST